MRVTIKSDIKKHLVQYGFIRRANDYYRIVNDMVQGIHIKEKHVMGVVALDIRFEMFPLCHDISWRDGKEKLDAFSLFDGYSIWQLYPPRDHLIMFEFNYTPGDYGSVLQCLANMINAIDTYLIPFFDRYDSCEALYADENNVYCRLTNLYDLALKTGDIDSAISYQQSQIERSYLLISDYRDENMKNGDLEGYNRYKQRILDNNTKRDNIINWLKTTTQAEIAEFIDNIENENRKRLLSKPN